MNKIIAHGVVAGLISAIAGIVYFYAYQQLLFLDFSAVINASSIAGASMLACLIMAGGYLLLYKINKPKLEGIFNLVYIVIAFASILMPISVTLPLDIDFPELFPGLAVPMHFFPPMVFFGLAPFFKQTPDLF